MKEQEIEAAAQELERLRMQLENLNRQDELIQVTLEEYIRARQALDELKDKKEGEEILVPVGANCWVHAKLGKIDKGIASIGSNVAVGQKLGDIIERLDTQLVEIRKADTELSGKITKVESRARDLSVMLQDVYDRQGSGQSR
ncbi:MAG: prefoldin subunit alpha [Candidatus Thermoplasmatota archaeon]|nr:prefoldin subunit alpha [Euryarchaeota archaeon]MBU4031722.1 prefoldin subunit alpha [Candidatus Thermoplasmatota archaeon]MBU4070752.1 prefoldin subunit alpha [Candidatus Thermoplasmatota archaeon]MBU4144739.1 prefoldin subunit alpha [Candidatus Thermoplasmatota archaeon]MBU4592841.1 prefoldin subunit alpha [Candidatus Thermoplasmatota archaeon]